MIFMLRYIIFIPFMALGILYGYFANKINLTKTPLGWCLSILLLWVPIMILRYFDINPLWDKLFTTTGYLGMTSIVSFDIWSQKF